MNLSSKTKGLQDPSVLYMNGGNLFLHNEQMTNTDVRN